MSALTLPYDEECERAVAGAVIRHRDAHRRLSRYCTADDFHSPTLREVFRAAPAAWAETPPPPPPPSGVRADFSDFRAAVERDPALLARVDEGTSARERERRIRFEFLARAGNIDVSKVADIEAAAILSEAMARRVADLARRRVAMEIAADVFNALGTGAGLEEIAPHVARLVRVLEGADEPGGHQRHVEDQRLRHPADPQRVRQPGSRAA